MEALNCVGNHHVSGPVPATGVLLIRFVDEPSRLQQSRPLCTDCRILIMAAAQGNPRVASVSEEVYA